jgi:hypothetical protein
MKKKYLFKRGKESCDFKSSCQCGNAVYGLGVIGSALYFISTATGFWAGVLGILKAIIWPAILVYGLLKSIGI